MSAVTPFPNKVAFRSAGWGFGCHMSSQGVTGVTLLCVCLPLLKNWVWGVTAPSMQMGSLRPEHRRAPPFLIKKNFFLSKFILKKLKPAEGLQDPYAELVLGRQSTDVPAGDRMAHVAAPWARLWHVHCCSTKATIDTTERNGCGRVPIKLYLQKRVTGRDVQAPVASPHPVVGRRAASPRRLTPVGELGPLRGPPGRGRPSLTPVPPGSVLPAACVRHQPHEQAAGGEGGCARLGRGALVCLWHGPKGVRLGQSVILPVARRGCVRLRSGRRRPWVPGRHHGIALGPIARISASCVFHWPTSGRHWSSTAESAGRRLASTVTFPPTSRAPWLLCQPQFGRVRSEGGVHCQRPDGISAS